MRILNTVIELLTLSQLLSQMERWMQWQVYQNSFRTRGSLT